MSRSKSLMHRLGLLVRRERFRTELDEEMAFHRNEAQREFEAQGMSREAARKAVLRQFGNTLKLRQQSHDVIGFRFESVWQDMRYATRQMLRSPGFTLAVVLTLALGTGANTAIFSVLHATILRTLPYPDADRIVGIQDVRIKGQSTGGLTAVPRFFDLQDRSKSFESLAFYCFENPTLIVDAGRSDSLPEQLKGSCATGQFFQVLGVGPALGRTFTPEDDRLHSAPVIVLSYSAWQRLFAGRQDAIGKTITVDKQPATVIGVMPQDFNFPAKVEMWRPARFDLASWRGYRGDGTRFVNVIGRMTSAATLATAKAEVRGLAAQMASEHPETDAPWQFQMDSLQDQLYGSLKSALLIIMAASTMLLVIACANVANLLSSRATARQREIALRQAMGASRARVLRQFITENILLAGLGGAVGLGLAYALLRLAATKLPGTLRSTGVIELDWAVIGYAVGLSLLTGILFSLAAAFKNRSLDLNTRLKSGEARHSGTGSTMRGVFISVQVGMSLVLLVGACLMAESLWKLTRTPLGFQPDHVVTFAVELPWNGNAAIAQNFYNEVQRRIEGIAGVHAAGQISALPTVSWHVRTSYDVDWKPRTSHRDAISVELRVIAGHYLQAMSIPLLAGRDLRDPDRDALLVNQEFARMYFAGGNPIGRHIFATDGGSATIVGIIGNSRGTAGSISADVVPEVYYAADGLTKRYFVVRSSLNPAQLIPVIRNEIHRIDSQQSIGSVHTLDELLSMDTAEPSLYTGLLVCFALLALTLACVGIYGVIAYSVAQRRQEIGVRMALGSTRVQISRLFLRRAMTSTLIGLSGGTAGALLLSRLLRSQLYGVEANNPTAFVIAILLLLIPVIAASLRPAIKAASVDPVEALRAE